MPDWKRNRISGKRWTRNRGKRKREKITGTLFSIPEKFSNDKKTVEYSPTRIRVHFKKNKIQQHRALYLHAKRVSSDLKLVKPGT